MKNAILASALSFILLSSFGLIVSTARATSGDINLPAEGNTSGSNTGNTSGSNTGNTSGSNTPAPSAPISIKIANPFKCGGNADSCTLQALLLAIIDGLVMPIGGMLCVLAFIWAGFKYVTAQGNTTKIAEAHRAVIYAALGTALLLGAKVFSTVIESTINQLQ